MDPNTALLDAIFAACDGELEDFDIAVHSLREWIERGGALPDLTMIRRGLN